MEVVVVMTVFLIILGGTQLTISSLQGRNERQRYINDFEGMTAFIAKARSYAQASRLNDSWGVKMIMQSSSYCGTSTKSNCLVIFKGADYGTRDPQYDEYLIFSSDLYRYDEPNNDDEIYYNKASGWGRGFDNASSTDATNFRLRTLSGTYDCKIMLGIFGAIYNSCES